MLCRIGGGTVEAERLRHLPARFADRSLVVYNEQQLTDQPVPTNTGRGLIVKYTHMLAF